MPKVPYNLDAWDGYAAERYMLLETALHNNNNLSFFLAIRTMRGAAASSQAQNTATFPVMSLQHRPFHPQV